MKKFLDSWNGAFFFSFLGLLDFLCILICPSLAIPLTIVGTLSIAISVLRLCNKWFEKKHPKKEIKIREVDKSELNNMPEEWLLNKLDYYLRKKLYSATLVISQTEDEDVVVRRVTKSDLDVALTVKKANAIRERKQKEEENQLITDTLKDLSEDKIENRDEVVSALINKEWKILENRKIKQTPIDTLNQNDNQTNASSLQSNTIKTERVDVNKTDKKKTEDEMDLSGFKPEMADYIKKLKQRNKKEDEDSDTLNV